MLYGLNVVKDQLPPNWLLLAVGRDVAGNVFELRRLSAERGLSQQVRFVGERRDVTVVLSAAETHVSASHSEGFPNNVLEATCAGLPVLATTVHRVIELVTGWRWPARFSCSPFVDYSFPIERSAASLEQAYSWLGEICFDRQPWMRGSASPEIRAGRVS